MKWFTNLRIATKLIAGFMLIAFMTAAMGVFTLINIKSLDNSSKHLYENMMVPSESAAMISINFQRILVYLRQGLLMEDTAGMQAEFDKISALSNEITTYAADFEASIEATEEMQQLLEELNSARAVFIPLMNQAMEMALSGQKAEAIALLSDTGEAGIAADVEREVIDRILTAQIQNGATASVNNTAQANSVVTITLIVMGFVLVFSIAIGLVFAKMVSKPIKAVANCAKALAAGDLDAPLNVKSQDETGQLANTINQDVRLAFKTIEHSRIVSEKQAEYQSVEVSKLLVNLQQLARGDLNCDLAVEEADEDTKGLYLLFNDIADNFGGAVSTIKGYIKEISETLAEISRGNLSVAITSDYKGDFVELKRSINNIVVALNATLSEINNAANQVSTGTQQVSEGSQTISQGATEQASSIEELSATIAEIASQTKQNAMNANNANELANSAKKGAIDGNVQMKALQKAMEEINESSENISKIIKVIDDIAFQTNILALNAAVEAARAGVHGKGFAVVAEEVRNLAAKSANAASETTALIEGSIKKVEAGTKIANETAGALGNIVEGVEKAAELVGDIAVASNEQATGITQVNNGIDQLSQVVQTNSATAEEAAAASEELSSQANLLMHMVSEFKLQNQSEENIKLVDNASESGRKSSDKSKANKSKGGTPRIALNDVEFGKY